jgi:hypothetical protein
METYSLDSSKCEVTPSIKTLVILTGLLYSLKVINRMYMVDFGDEV